jgi:hypothetical protein
MLVAPLGLAQDQSASPDNPVPPHAADSGSPPPPSAATSEGPPESAPVPDPAGAFAGGSSAWAAAAVGPTPFRADYRAAWFPDEHVVGQATVLGYVRQDLGLVVPIWQDGPDGWAASFNGRSEVFHTHAVLPTTDQPFPDELWNVRLGTTYRHQFDNGWIAGGTISVGSASDRPFHSIEEMTAGVNTFLRVPQGDHNAWLFTLSYSPTSELPFPIPGVAFLYQPSDRFRANIGLPFQLMYRPVDDLTLDLSYMLLRTVHARATYRVYGRVRVYAGFDWDNESYFLADRPDERERFFSYDKRLTGGVLVPFGHVLLDLSSGYVFDRFYFEGRSYSDRNQNRIDVGNGPFGVVRLEARF